MTFDQWKDINMPDWRDMVYSGFNNPNEGWYWQYKQDMISEQIKQLNQTRPPITINIPHDIIEAAEKVDLWFAERGIDKWQIGNIQSRR